MKEFEKAMWCFRRARELGVKGIIIYLPHTILVAGWPIGRDTAVNDNEAKP